MQHGRERSRLSCLSLLSVIPLIVDGGGIRIFTRNGFDWSEKYAPLVKAAAAFGVKNTIIDGEIIVPDPATGLTDFQALRPAIRNTPERLIFVALDLLFMDSHDLRGMALEERRHLPEDMIGDSDTGGRFQFSEPLADDAKELFRQIDRAKIEGMVSKSLDTRYTSGKYVGRAFVTLPQDTRNVSGNGCSAGRSEAA